MRDMKNIKQLTLKQSIKLMNKVYKMELALEEKISMLNNKEKSIQALIIQMMELQEDLKYETRLNVELSSKLNK
jgi:hypothetical protein